MIFELRYYVTSTGRVVFRDWFEGLRDRQAQVRIRARLDRVGRGLLGDAEPCGEGVSELRIDWGPGYRIYFGRAGLRVILLLAGGDKRTQAADIKQAKENWHDYQTRIKAKGARPH